MSMSCTNSKVLQDTCKLLIVFDEFNFVQKSSNDNSLFFSCILCSRQFTNTLKMNTMIFKLFIVSSKTTLKTRQNFKYKPRLRSYILKVTPNNIFRHMSSNGANCEVLLLLNLIQVPNWKYQLRVRYPLKLFFHFLTVL